jgi:thiosulfate/3-mercaptopyruvate sulfurtransferase
MTSPFISVGALAEALASDAPPVVIDASLILHSPQFDGDYRRESGESRWRAGHIPGSFHVDVSSQFSDPAAALHYTHPSAQAIVDELARLGVRESDDIVIYDSTGTLWAARLWYLLRWSGVPSRVLDGGFAAWKAAGLPVESGKIARSGEAVESGAPASRQPVVPWQASIGADAWVDQDELLERAEADDRPLVCGLPAGSFSGADPTRYSRPGRIPGSVNVSSRGLFDASGRVKPVAELAEAYQSQGVALDADAPEVLLYCGGGISASANALTLAELGFSRVRIYDGSLEEWSANPALPLESVR